MFPLLLATGFSFEATHTITENALVATFLVLYTFAYSPGAGVVPFLYSSEIFPQMLRGQTTLLGLFAGLDAFALIMVWLFVPGTERQIATMEEMNYVFGVTTRRHMDYQVNQVAPWCYDHYIRRRKKNDLPPLYRYARLRETTNAT
ncbi:MAG: hypothetical protein LQ342_008168 [Letrouitia transgressa]|nr:MAG: hypothetical protein LQ342_008168 [Letrouitia transgressa]